MKKSALPVLIASALILSAPTSFAATTKPIPKPTIQVIAKVTLKKTVVLKQLVRKKVKISPSPAPAWPPRGFSHIGVVYAKTPTKKELLGILSAAKPLAAQVKNCSKVACGAVQVASSVGCTWWEVTSTVWGPTSNSGLTTRPYGTLRNSVKGSAPKQIITILLLSTEPLKRLVTVRGINVNCYHSPVTGRIPSNNYTAITPTPTPTITPTPTSSD